VRVSKSVEILRHPFVIFDTPSVGGKRENRHFRMK